MKKTRLIVIKTGNVCDDLACGECASVLYGYDEEICPVCGSFVDMSNPMYHDEESYLEYCEEQALLEDCVGMNPVNGDYI